METSICEDEGQFAALVEDAVRSSSGDGFSFSSAATLKKNLAETFDQQVSRVDHVARYEQVCAVPSMPVVASGCSSVFAKPSSSAFGGAQQTLKRPPLASGYANGNDESFSSKKVAVYLRIRPMPRPASSKRNINDNDEDMKHDANVSTIEVLESLGGKVPTTIRTYPPSISNSYKVNINRKGRDSSTYAKEFDFDRVMGPETSQKTVYSTVVAPMIQDLLQAVFQPKVSLCSVMMSTSKDTHESALLFSYGITNAGKTHTVIGDINSSNQAKWGLIPRAIADVFDRMRIITASSSTQQCPPCELHLSFFEIYNELVFDLMPAKTSNDSSSKTSAYGPPNALKVRECRGKTIVRGLAKHKVDNVEQGIEITKMAQNKRHTSSNNLNSDSSRSHFVCQIRISSNQNTSRNDLAPQPHRASTINDDDVSVASMSGYSTDEEAASTMSQASCTLWIVDLAGSERSKRTGVGNARQKESTQINMSLMTLMRCLNAIKDTRKHGVGSNIVVPFRESKLTHIFMNHLSSKSAARTVMMVNVNPSVEDFDETQHVLAYARKARLIEMKPEDYSRKRKQCNQEEYSMDGRKKQQTEVSKQAPPTKQGPKKPANLFSRMAKRLSPKRALQKRMPGSNKTAGDTNTFLGSLVGNVAAATSTCESFNHASDIESVRTALASAEAEANALRYENARLEEEMGNKEHQIRTEVSMEMEERLRETRMKHQEKLESLRSQMQKQRSKTEFTVSMNKAEDQLEELLDKVDECEKEMVRMNDEHGREIGSLKATMKLLHGELQVAVAQREQASKQVRHLEKELEAAHCTIRRLQVTRGEVVEGDSICENSNEFGDNEASRRVLAASKTGGTASPKKASAFGDRLRPRKGLHNCTNQRAV